MIIPPTRIALTHSLATIDRALEILTKHRNAWTKGAFARSSHERTSSNAVWETDPNAVCWCAVGVINKAAFDVTGRRVFSNSSSYVLQTLRSVIPTTFPEGSAQANIVRWNDSLTQKRSVVAAFKRARKVVEKELGRRHHDLSE